jgi:uncharacterized protein (DUF58 family)
MLPIPTDAAIQAFLGCAAMLVVGLFTQSPTATMLAGGAMLGLSTALGLTMAVGARLRRQRTEFAWWLDQGEPGHTIAGVVVGVPFDVRCSVRNRSQRPMSFVGLLPVVPAGTRIHGGGTTLELPARTRTEFVVRLSASATGRLVLQGLAVMVPGPFGLFLAPLYFPSPLSVKAMPRSAFRSIASSRMASGESIERAGLTPLRRRGAGMELHEIREHRPGDSFKTIAWKASARAGKLLVREVEREVQDTLQLVLDVSGSMRGGAPGERRLDQCIELTAMLARQALERGDRVGLLAVDGREVVRVGEADGMRHLLRIYDALLAVTEVVDADLTAIDDVAVTSMVGLYVKQQEGLDFSTGGRWDLAGLSAHAAKGLQTEPERERVVASSVEHGLLRRYCRVRGLALPYRADTRGFAKAVGLAQALRTAAGAGRAPRTVITFTDFDGNFDLDSVLQAVKLVRARQHSVTFVVPDAEGQMPAPKSELERALRRVYALQERRRLVEARSALGNLGADVLRYAVIDASGGAPRSARALRSVA